MSFGPATQGHWELTGLFLSLNPLFASNVDVLPGPLQLAQVTGPAKSRTLRFWLGPPMSLGPCAMTAQDSEAL